MIVHRSQTYRLYPSPEQEARLRQWVGAVRCVYNLALEQRQTFSRQGRSINVYKQTAEIKHLRAEFDWIGDAPGQCFVKALRDLDLAYKRWFAGKSGAPSFRRRGVNDSFRVSGGNEIRVRRLSRRIGQIRIPKIEWIPLRWDRALIGEMRTVTVSFRGGVWTAAIQCRVELADPAKNCLPAIGIDRGIAVFAATSDGLLLAPANHGKRALRALARAQRSLARKQKGSNNRRKQVQRLARVHVGIRAARRDFLHKVSAQLAKNHGSIVLEKLEVRSLTRSASGTVEKPGKNVRQKAGLNRSILDQGWGEFRTMLAYKLAERGGELIEVSPAYTSQTCAECGVIDAASREAQCFNCTTAERGNMIAALEADLERVQCELDEAEAALTIERQRREEDVAYIDELCAEHRRRAAEQRRLQPNDLSERDDWFADRLSEIVRHLRSPTDREEERGG